MSHIRDTRSHTPPTTIFTNTAHIQLVKWIYNIDMNIVVKGTDVCHMFSAFYHVHLADAPGSTNGIVVDREA